MVSLFGVGGAAVDSSTAPDVVFFLRLEVRFRFGLAVSFDIRSVLLSIGVLPLYVETPGSVVEKLRVQARQGGGL